MSILIILLTVDPVEEEHSIIHGGFYSPTIANYVDSFGSREVTNLLTPVSIIDYEAWRLLVCGATQSGSLPALLRICCLHHQC